jgi:cell cycle sensor histidine kinase DivJ
LHARTPKPLVRADAVDGLWWHGGWAGMVAMSGLALVFPKLNLSPLTLAALLVIITPSAAAALVLGLMDSARSRAGLLVLWSVCGGLAVILTGGLTGPLAVWCLVPLAAASILGREQMMHEAAALSLFTAGVVAFSQLTGTSVVAPPPTVSFWLSLLGILTTSAGLGVGLVMARSRKARSLMESDQTLMALETLLAGQPQLLITLSPYGLALSAYGQAPQGITADRLFADGLVGVAAQADRPAVLAALERAATEGRAQVGFAPLAAMEAAIVADIRRLEDGRTSAVLRDVTLERAREAALDLARADAEALNASKSRFLANMSHELRTPLNAIMGFSDIMRARMFGTLPGKYAEYAELIHESGRHLLDLINDVLDMSKIQAERFDLSLERFDVRDPVSAGLRLLRLQADEAGVRLRGVLPAAPLEVHADRRAVKQIVINLLSNALKFTPKGGQVTVTAQAYGDSLEIVVADTGMGISEADLARLGRPFEQAGDAATRAGGTGLGLSLVRAFAELHGGDMTLESRLGEGTAVTVRLPVLAPADDSDPGLANG